MRLLFLTPQPPYPPQQGAALRNWGLIRELAARHEVHLLTFAEQVLEQPGLASVTVLPPPVRRAPQRLRDLLLSPDPDMARRFWSPPMVRALEGLLERHDFDAVQVEGIEMLPFVRPYLGRRERPRFVYDAHNAEAALQRSAFRADLRNPRRLPQALYSAVQALKLARYERAVLPRVDLVCAVSDEDARLLRAPDGPLPLVLPNGVDSDALSPGAVPPDPSMLRFPGPRLLFTGKLDFRPNVDALLWLVEEILPRVTSRRGEPRLWAVGQSPHASLEPLRANPQVVLTGYVPGVEPFIAAADVVVVPLRMGSGTRLKVLQALSMEKSLVGTTLGCAGLGLRHTEHLLLADEPVAFAHAVTQLLDDPALGQALASRARRHVRARFDWRVLVPVLERRLLELTGA